jgi:hypothetical protein
VTRCGQRAGTRIDRASRPTGAPGFDLGSAISTNPNAHNLTRVFAEMIVEQIHLNRKPMIGRAHEPTLALNTRA